MSGAIDTSAKIRSKVVLFLLHLTAHVQGEIEGLVPLCFCESHQIDNSSDLYVKSWIGVFTEY
jgi:hypothetical protein